MTTGYAMSPLLPMARETRTDWRNDSCDVGDLASAIKPGCHGATSNPTIVVEVLRGNREDSLPRVREIGGLVGG